MFVSVSGLLVKNLLYTSWRHWGAFPEHFTAGLLTCGPLYDQFRPVLSTMTRPNDIQRAFLQVGLDVSLGILILSLS
jgi:hypothetical protein